MSVLPPGYIVVVDSVFGIVSCALFHPPPRNTCRVLKAHGVYASGSAWWKRGAIGYHGCVLERASDGLDKRGHQPEAEEDQGGP